MANLIFPENGYIFDTHTDKQNTFITKIHKEGTEKAIEWMYSIKNKEEWSYPREIELRWEKDESEIYIVELSEAEDFSCCKRIETSDTFCSFGNLKIGRKYFWKVNGSEIRYFITLDNIPRFIKINGALNVRDLGGNKIKQGILYRGTEFDEFYPLEPGGRETIIDELKIKTQLDVRGAYQLHIDDSPIKDKVELIQIRYRPYMEIFEPAHRQHICEIMQVFADETKYPIYINCVGGADRTGMIAMYLRAIAGESDDDIFTDYELTGLSTYSMGLLEGVDNGKRWRTAPYFLEFLTELKKYAEPNAPLSVLVRAFLMDCGVTQECIEKIASIIKNN